MKPTDNKIRPWHDTPTHKWLSLEEYHMPHFVIDYFEYEWLLVKNRDEDQEWHKVQLPFQPPEGFVWTFIDDYDEEVEVTHFMLIE